MIWIVSVWLVLGSAVWNCSIVRASTSPRSRGTVDCIRAGAQDARTSKAMAAQHDAMHRTSRATEGEHDATIRACKRIPK